jgi:hypothetical protein
VRALDQGLAGRGHLLGRTARLLDKTFPLRRPTRWHPSRLGPLTLTVAALGLGCTSTITGPLSDGNGAVSGGAGNSVGSGGTGAKVGAGGTAASTTGSGGANGVSASSGAASGGTTGTPTLAQVADGYFPSAALSSPAKRVFRLTRTQLDLTTKTLLPGQFDATAEASLPRDPLQTNYEYSDNLGFNPANFTPFVDWVAGLADAVKGAPTSVIDCGSSDPSKACLTDQARKFVSRAFRGTASDAQLARYGDFFVADVAAVGLAEATSTLVDLVLTSPHYAFRDEVLTDAAGALKPAEQLQNITYTLTDAPPEAVGLSSVDPSAYVATPELAQQTIDRVLESAEARAKLTRFFMAWLEVKEPDEFTIATSTFPEFTPEVAAAVVEETRSFLERQLAQAAPSMQDITEKNPASVAGATAFLYRGAGDTGSVELDPSQRLGIFTQPAVLASHSGPTTSRLVKRGVFFVRKIMCMPLGSPPADVDTTVPTTGGATERERIEAVTTPARCAGCHAAINPFGFMLENFDAIGRFRTTDEGAPIDASIDVDFLDEGPMSTSSPVDALRTFTRSWRFQQCFARQLFRFYMGRDETAGDDPTLRQMFYDFADNDEQDVVRMLRTLASSTTFSSRVEAP